MQVHEAADSREMAGSVGVETGDLNERNTDLAAMLQPHVSFPVGSHNIVDAVQSLLDQMSFIRSNLKDAIQSHHDSLEAIQNLQDILKAAQLLNEPNSSATSIASVPVAATSGPLPFCLFNLSTRWHSACY